MFLLSKTKIAAWSLTFCGIILATKKTIFGIMIGKYRPDDVDDELEIFVRYADKERSIDQLDNIMIETMS